MAIEIYNQIQNNQPLIIGNNALDINNQNFYCIVRDNYLQVLQNENLEMTQTLPSQMNIRTIQQIYLDLAKTTKPVCIGGVNINFNDNDWDFSSQYKPGKPPAYYMYHFQTEKPLSDYQIIVMKLFVMFCITEYGLHCGSNHARFSEVKRFMEYMRDNNIIVIEHLSLKDYKNFYDARNMQYSTFVKCRRHIQDLLTFYSIIAKNVYTKELNQWFTDIDTDAINAGVENNKTPLLPSDFYKSFATELYNHVMDPQEDKQNRGYYGLLYIGTQTGLRASELTLLRVQDLEVRTFKDKAIGILHYRSTKTGNGKNHIYDHGQTNANQKVISVYKTLESLFAQEREELKTDFLVIKRAHPNNNEYVERHQVLGATLQFICTQFCIEHSQKLKVLNLDDPSDFCGQHIVAPEKRFIPLSVYEKAKLRKGDIVSYPTIRQFRVYVASELRERGVDDRTTAFLLNHHCVEMYGYYARPKHSIQEDIDFSKEIVADIVRDGTKILGPKGDALTAKIDKIIEENNFNVEKDLDAIIDKVCNEMPIRAKNGGFCMKSNPRRECRHDAQTDEFMCAYGCCPNHCHMYFMLPISYEKVKTLLKTYEYNIQAGFVNAAEKEAYKLNYAINSELLPELHETRNELTKRTAESIINSHPGMAVVIDRLDDIEKEVQEWKRQTEKKP